MPEYITKDDLNTGVKSDTIGLNKPIKALDQINVGLEKIGNILNTFKSIRQVVKPEEQNKGAFARTETLVNKGIAQQQPQQPAPLPAPVQQKTIIYKTEEACKELLEMIKQIDDKKTGKEFKKELNDLHKQKNLIPFVTAFLTKFAVVENA